ncbi:MAG: nucleotidyltransferase [Gemmataceae bacterium]|nr:nucleotidyltransferase [Gemmataceae bacterium]
MADEQALPLPLDLLTALQEQVQVLEQGQFRYALIGGIATGYRSRPRFTQDLDFLLDVPLLAMPGLLEKLRQRGFAANEDTVVREWAHDHLTVLSFRGVRIDWLKPVVPLYQHVIDQARTESWLGGAIRIAAPEGLILTKLLGFRPQDQVDIASLLTANLGQLDLPLIRNEWQSIVPANDPRIQWFEEQVRRTTAT